jgi:hypothetical protein
MLLSLPLLWLLLLQQAMFAGTACATAMLLLLTHCDSAYAPAADVLIYSCRTEDAAAQSTTSLYHYSIHTTPCWYCQWS